jgi:nucleotide-binding universal stress UspA family protein
MIDTKRQEREDRLYSHIMIPIDLAHADRLDRAIATGADLARLYGADITFVGVTSPLPGAAAHSPQEFQHKLEAFAARQAEARGVTAKARAVVAHDPSVEMDKLLLKTAQEVGADLVVMATHVPHGLEWPSHGGHLASHAAISVMLVRAG